MIIGFDQGIVVCHLHFFTTNHGADACAFRQVYLFNASTHNPGRSGIAMRNRFDGFGSTAPQRVHGNHIASANMGEQSANGHLLR